VTYEIHLSHQAKRALSEELPPVVAVACFEFIRGPLAENPRCVGKPLHAPLEPYYSARRGAFRVIYDIQEALVLVEVVTFGYRRDTYRMD
jgi:mRNA-degrading endonuclease RelE of RelBE toxin-antitoxin system